MEVLGNLRVPAWSEEGQADWLNQSEAQHREIDVLMTQGTVKMVPVQSFPALCGRSDYWRGSKRQRCDCPEYAYTTLAACAWLHMGGDKAVALLHDPQPHRQH